MVNHHKNKKCHNPTPNFTGLRLMPPALLVKNLSFLRSHFFLTAKKTRMKLSKKSTENRSNLNPKSTKTLPWTGLCGAMGGLGWQVGDQGRLWQVLEPPQPSRWSRAEPKLEPCWGQVEIFWSRKCDFGGLEKPSGNWNRFSKIFEAVQSSLKLILYCK